MNENTKSVISKALKEVLKILATAAVTLIGASTTGCVLVPLKF